jgi:GxxExxY protein
VSLVLFEVLGMPLLFPLVAFKSVGNKWTGLIQRGLQMALKHEELTKVILECIFEAHNEVGVGLDEESYHQVLLDCFLRKGVPAISKERKHLVHRDVSVRRFELDLLVYEKIILALKSLPCVFLQNHYVQIISELKLWQKDLGLLVNFGRLKTEIERIPFDEKEKKVIEDYSEVKGKIEKSARESLAGVRDAVLFVHETHGLGYGMAVYRDLLRAEFNHQKIVHDSCAPLHVKYRDKLLRSFKVKALRVADQLLCRITAIQDQITLFDVKRMRTYLQYSGIPIGLLINFGKSNLEIKAISR